MIPGGHKKENIAVIQVWARNSLAIIQSYNYVYFLEYG